jgi:hypothetical protein
MAYKYSPHARTLEHMKHDVTPPKTTDERVGLNGHIGLFVTTVVGTMWCAYLFTIIALVSLPDAIKSGNNIIIVGQNIQAKTADRRAESTYKDAEAVLNEALEIQSHLAEQDKQLELLTARAS